MRRRTCAPQEGLVHFQATPSFETEAPQEGQCRGISKTRSEPLRSSFFTSTTAGMTSPAFSMSTVSPMRMSFRWISSSLWRVARETVLPETKTG